MQFLPVRDAAQYLYFRFREEPKGNWPSRIRAALLPLWPAYKFGLDSTLPKAVRAPSLPLEGDEVAMAYETGMSIEYHVPSATLTVRFRGQEMTMHVSASADDAIQAGEKVCRDLGWKPDARPDPGMGRAA